MAKQNISEALKTFDRKYAATRLPAEVANNFSNEVAMYVQQIGKALAKDESEENIKNIINKFLERTFYPTPEYTVNTHNNIDSAIMRDDKLLVLIETKRPANKNEMITESNVNRKALWELVYYYLLSTRDSSGKKVKRIPNIEIRRLVITDSQSWAIFDANDIEKICDGYLENHFYRYSNCQLHYSNDLKKFYNDIETYLSKIDVNQSLKFVFFDFTKLTKTKTGCQQLFKILSHEYLLKEKSRQSIQQHELSSKFYKELLYLMGLEEVKQKSNSIICINKKNPNTFAWQLFNKYVNDKERSTEEAEEKTFELLIIWLNRILFIKLFEGQLVAFNGNSEKYRLLDKNKISSFTDLQQLFFDVLGKKDRESSSFFDKFSAIPYLNSSLFERQKIETDDFNINDLRNDSVTLMPKSVLGNKPATLPLLTYLIDFLNSYVFMSQNEEDNTDHEEIIDARVLGLIFEKINGYKDGAVYTPSAITEYMSKTAIESNLLKRINEQMQWHCEDFDDVRFNISSISTARKVNDIINATKICDPAVGSGHFLVSALNQMIAIKAELGVLFKYGKDQRLNEVDIFVEGDVLHVVDAQGHSFKYQKENLLSQEIQETLFNEKRTIIEECLFGVDVNAKAVYICQLRLWIELLKHAYYKHDVMQTLPNIDINIRVGNSLISQLDFTPGRKKGVAKSFKPTERKLLAEYKSAVKEYKATASKANKKAIKANISNLKNNISFVLAQDNFLDPRARKNFAIYEDAFEWAFEFPELIGDDGTFTGFDIIIENPPYGLINKRQNRNISIAVENAQAEYYKQAPEYAAAMGGVVNIFRLFICRTYQLLKPDGYASLIFPLAFTCDLSCSNIRKFLFNSASIDYIEAFPERDFEKKRVFDAAKISVCIVGFTKGSKAKSKQDFEYRINNDKFVNLKLAPSSINLAKIKSIDEEGLAIPLATQQEIDLLAKISEGSIRCKTISKCYTGEIDITFGKKYITYDETDSAMIRGAQVQKYRITNDISQGQIMYLKGEQYLCENKSAKSRHHQNRRIVLQGITGVNEKTRLKMTLIDGGTFCANSVNYLMPKDEDGNMEYLLAVLNSSLINWVFAKQSTNSNVNGYEVDNLPIKQGNQEQRSELIALVKSLLDGTGNLDATQKKIDSIVYSIYGLNEDDIAVIEQA